MKVLFSVQTRLFSQKNPRIFLYEAVDENVLENIDVSDDIKRRLLDQLDKDQLSGGIQGTLEDVIKVEMKEQFRDAREVLRDDKTVDHFAAQEEFFHAARGKESPREKLDAELRVFLGEKLRREFTDTEWALMRQELLEDAAEFYEKAQKEHGNYCQDSAMVERELEDFQMILGQSVDQDFASFDDFLEHWKTQGIIKDKLATAKGDRKNLLEKKLVELAKTEWKKYEKTRGKSTKEKEQKNKELAQESESELKDALEDFLNDIQNQKGFENMSAEDFLNAGHNALNQVDLMKLQRASAEKLVKDFDAQLKEKVENLFPLQIEAKLKQSEAVFKTLLADVESGKVKGSLEDIEQHGNKQLEKLHLFKNLPKKFRDQLDKKLKSQWEKYQTKIEKKADLIPQNKMAVSWEKYLSSLSSYQEDFKSLDDFQKKFLKKYFPDKANNAKKYFADHPNFQKAFEKSFDNYEKAQNKKLEADYKNMLKVISDPQMRAGMQNEFGKKDRKYDRYLLKYVGEHASLYEKSIQNIPGLEETLSASTDPKIGEKFKALKSAYEKNKSTYVKGVFVSPRTYEAQLLKLQKNLKPEQTEQATAKEKNDFQKRMDQMSLEGIDVQNPALKNKKAFYRALWQGTEWISDQAWDEYGGEMFYTKADQLHEEFKQTFAETEKLGQKIKTLDLKDLDTESDFKNINEFVQQPALRQWFEKLQVSDQAYDALRDSAVKPHLTRLYAAYKNQKNSAENLSESKEVQNAKKVIDSVTVDKLDLTKDFANPDVFGRQKALHEDIWFDPAVFDQVADYFEVKNLELYAEHQEVRSDMKRLEKAFDGLSLKDLDTNATFKDIEEFKAQPAFRKLFEKIGASDLAYDALKESTLDGHFERLWGEQQTELVEDGADFSLEDMQKIGNKHGLTFEKLRLENTDNLAQKFGRLEELMKRSYVFPQLLRRQEHNMVPFFLDMLGEMTVTDFNRLLSDVNAAKPTRQDQLVEIMFADNPRRQYLANEARKKNYESWRKLGIAEKSLQTPSIQDLITKRDKIDAEVQDMQAEADEKAEKEQEIVADIAEELEEEILEEEELEIVDTDEIEQELDDQLVQGEDGEELAEEINEDDEDMPEGEENLDEEGDEDAEQDEGLDEEVEAEDENKAETPVETTEEGDEEVAEEDETAEKNAEFLETEEDEAEDSLENVETGDEVSLAEDYKDFLDQADTTPAHFAELYCPTGITLKELLHRIDMYVMLMAGKPVQSFTHFEETELEQVIKNPTEIFEDIVNFILDQDLPTLKTIAFSGQVTDEEIQLNVLLEKQFGMTQRDFQIETD